MDCNSSTHFIKVISSVNARPVLACSPLRVFDVSSMLSKFLWANLRYLNENSTGKRVGSEMKNMKIMAADHRRSDHSTHYNIKCFDGSYVMFSKLIMLFEYLFSTSLKAKEKVFQRNSSSRWGGGGSIIAALLELSISHSPKEVLGSGKKNSSKRRKSALNTQREVKNAWLRLAAHSTSFHSMDWSAHVIKTEFYSTFFASFFWLSEFSHLCMKFLHFISRYKIVDVLMDRRSERMSAKPYKLSLIFTLFLGIKVW